MLIQHSHRARVPLDKKDCTIDCLFYGITANSLAFKLNSKSIEHHQQVTGILRHLSGAKDTQDCAAEDKPNLRTLTKKCS